MYGLIVKLTAVPGNRDALIAMLVQGTRNMPGCYTYIVARDVADENAIWVTEVWDSQASHDASLTLPEVTKTIAAAKPMVAGMAERIITAPVGGVGLTSQADRRSG